MTFPLPYFERCYVEGPDPKLDRSQSLVVGFSTRNRMFSSDFFRRVFSLSDSYFAKMLIVIVDVPYAFNEAAWRNSTVPYLA